MRMNIKFRSIIAILLTGIWVNSSEFFRNTILLKTYWSSHYQFLGVTFPYDVMNGIVWLVWGFLFAIAIYWISRKLNLIQTTLACWFMAFVLMWFITWDLTLPNEILMYAVPLSLLETFIGAYICKQMSPRYSKIWY